MVTKELFLRDFSDGFSNFKIKQLLTSGRYCFSAVLYSVINDLTDGKYKTHIFIEFQENLNSIFITNFLVINPPPAPF
jgi:hypothetical protein